MARRPKPMVALLGSAQDTETSFYEALQAGDIDRVMACWADDDEVVCIHPGGPRLIGLGAIRAAFEQLLNQGSLRIDAEAAHSVAGPDSAVHSVRERIEVLTPQGPMSAFVLATNVYQRTAQGWRLVCHHGSPAGQHEPADVAEKPPVLH